MIFLRKKIISNYGGCFFGVINKSSELYCMKYFEMLNYVVVFKGKKFKFRDMRLWGKFFFSFSVMESIFRSGTFLTNLRVVSARKLH